MENYHRIYSLLDPNPFKFNIQGAKYHILEYLEKIESEIFISKTYSDHFICIKY